MEARADGAGSGGTAGDVVTASSLRHHTDFRLLWAGNAVSQFGTRIGQITVPLLAVNVLSATPFQVGLLTSVQTVGLLLIGLPAGAWVDRMRRKKLMVAMDLARAVLLGSIAVAGWFGLLTYGQVLVATLLAGFATAFFDVAHLSYLPGLVGREHLVEGNAKLQASQSVAVVAGPALGGGLVSLLGAANTILATSGGYLLSALQIRRIRTEEHPVDRSAQSRLRTEVSEGLRFVFGNPMLRAIAGCTSTANFFLTIVVTLNVLFLVREVGLNATDTGLLLAASGVGGLIGAVVGPRAVRRLGRARMAWLSLLCTQPFSLLLPLAEPDWRVALFALGWFVTGSGSTAYNVAQVTFRQAVCPDRLLGRVNATNRFVVWGTMPLGALTAGVLADLAGIRVGLLVGAIGLSASVSWLLLSPLRRIHDIPEQEPAGS